MPLEEQVSTELVAAAAHNLQVVLVALVPRCVETPPADRAASELVEMVVKLHLAVLVVVVVTTVEVVVEADVTLQPVVVDRVI